MLFIIHFYSDKFNIQKRSIEWLNNLEIPALTEKLKSVNISEDHRTITYTFFLEKQVMNYLKAASSDDKDISSLINTIRKNDCFLDVSLDGGNIY